MKPSTDELLSFVAKIHHQLASDKDLQLIKGARKYAHLTTEAGKLLKRAGYLNTPPPASTPSEYVRRGEVAEALGVPDTTLRHWLASGKIPRVRTPAGRFLIPRDWLDKETARLAAERQQAGLQAK